MMKALKRDLQSVAKSLKLLTQKTERMASKLAKLEKTQADKSPRVRASTRTAKKTSPAKAKKVTATGSVLGIIQSSKNGVDTETLKRKTGFSDKKIWNIINRQKRQGAIKSVRRGFYVST
ncbi:MAG: hypothetical protein SV775_05410 [Thermodesulfobacteriota bacterium]|nr:hypothetical protein [Thermodesulfobacteriota bacterium]